MRVKTEPPDLPPAILAPPTHRGLDGWNRFVQTEGRDANVKRKPKDVDEYLAALDENQRTALQKLRETIQSAAPSAEECKSYQLPAFRQKKMLVAFGATKKHCALYLMNTVMADAHRDDLAGYNTSKGTVRFQPDKPLPPRLVRKLVKARLRENGVG